MIGAGIFGCLVATELAKKNHNVVLFEKEVDLLIGATSKSQNRLHLGLHYPRDLDTARQSVLGFANFVEAFPEAINLGFTNYYAIASNNSKVSADDFEAFSKAAGIEIKTFDSNSELPNGLMIKNVERIWECGEGVIDMNVLREMLRNEISKTPIDLRLDSEVLSLSKVGKKWILVTRQDESSFDFIVRCTYSSDAIEINLDGYENRSRIFHKTLIQVVESENNDFGITIVDGDFLTILPQGFSGKLLAYGPSVSTRRAVEAALSPRDWHAVSRSEVNLFQEQITSRINSWIENWDYRITEEYLETVRTIEVGVELTDRRTSQVLNSNKGMLDIWSGKIDHAIEISKKVPDIISIYQNRL